MTPTDGAAARDFDVVLVLGGGNALGAFQAGVYQALYEHNVLPNWIVGASIGAINGALIAGSLPERRLDALRGFRLRQPRHARRCAPHPSKRGAAGDISSG